MSLALADPVLDRATTDTAPRSPAPADTGLGTAIQEACARIAPVWPLSSFVAVNPFLGFARTPFERAASELHRLTGARILMPRSFYRQALREGRIAPEDLIVALAEGRGAGLTRERLLHAVMADPAEQPRPSRVATVSDVLDALSAGDREVSRTAFMIDQISKWCAAYFDAGQAAWPAPWRGMGLYEAWRWSVKFDGNPRAMGVNGLADTVAALSAEPVVAIAKVLSNLGIPADQWTDYLYRALFDVRGWAAYVRRLDWDAELAGEPGGQLVELLAIRLIWGYALFRQRTDETFVSAWRAALAASRASTGAPATSPDDLSVDLVLQRAYEHAFQKRLIEDLAVGPKAKCAQRPDVQTVFCIDVRSEAYRRALETVWPQSETLGFAGFFGMPLAYGADGERVHAHCPVLLRPGFSVHAQTKPSHPLVGWSSWAGSVWTELKQSAVSCFGFVEAFGLGYGAKLAAEAAGTGSVEPPPTPTLGSDGLALAHRIDLAEGALRGMSLTGGFARLVLLVGHASTTTNNPHAAGLDCGACGGRSGAPNARYAAALLNDAAVREGLAARGIAIPLDTWFVAALHDTTTDALWLLDGEAVPPSHAAELAGAAKKLESASRLVRAERAPLLGLSPAQADQVFARARDWSQVRPEWGLARAAAFIAAPRLLTQGRNLEGRAFLHSYDRAADPELKVLELILTAPMVVASWISLQYYGSTVDNAAFGSGDKTLHNVCGRVGVLEGNGGDLRIGLPIQSIHDGRRFLHEPLRLSVFIAAAPHAISKVLSRQPQVQALLDNGWVFLFALDDVGRTTHRYAGDLDWEVL
ncbi:YbcC family protein [Phenylobacterium montanum]|uniref:Probable inorganic carbon transporter subunit DabA n=1 Tax=Phenylobacterium montanum TaxID=2823693 RepID=A0A975G5U8_9CAUL|nr:DUF2309 domain-containing protein [Caulobacter sp. S6]QUD90611.1 DUF2309 domain-containing protein [Caulobacter sp. S6]